MARPYDKIIALDFETRWNSNDYTLSKLTTEEYIRDPRFKAFGACAHELGSEGKAPWIRHDDLPAYFDSIDWSRTAVLAHNAQFDVSIMEWVYDAHPCFIFDSLSMARALRGVEVGNSLMKLAQAFGLPDKGRAVHDTNGMLELDPQTERELAAYCTHDVYLCEQIFSKLMMQLDPVTGNCGGPYPTKELRLIDMTLKMYTRPVLELDQSMLTDALYDEKEKREALLQKIGVDESSLASNKQFAEVLRGLGMPPPYKKSKTTGKQTLALAKNDALFQAMLNGDNEDVAALCEARLKVKSTTERTRAQRFLDISKRGRLPVPLSYYGAKSGRWTASKGSAINMQNLKRGSFLRKAIMAPEGHQLVVGDLSQIEPRVLAWLADYEDMLLIFRQGGDPYAAFGAQMFNIPGLTKESHPDLRQSAKSALLGCFGPNTPVLTNRGWVPIVRVQATDTVWDGEEWVCHQGLVPQGEKEVLTAAGISATSDHEILTEHGWVEWSAALANRSLLKSVGAARQLVDSILLCSVPVGGQGLSTATTLLQGALSAAMPALKERLSRLDGNKKGTTWSALIDAIVTDCWTALAPSSSDAQTRIVPCTQTTVGAGLPFTKDGLRTALSSFVTSSGLAAGIDLNSSSIESITTGGMSPATCDSSAVASTCPTNDALLREKSKRSDSGSPPLKQRMQTYDIAYAGPRNRYTVLTWYGPIIVHNCGYGLGWASFAAQLLVGFLGAPPQRYDKDFAKKLGVTATYIQKFLEWDDNVKKMTEIPHTCTDAELLVHCVAAKMIIDKYRSTAWPVVAFWDMCGSLISRSLHGGEEVTYKCVTFRKEEIVLPNGMSLLYPNLRQVREKVKDEDGNEKDGGLQWVYGEDATKLYAGKITNNIVQGVARIVMTDGMLRVDKRYPVKGTVHDELISVVPDEEVEFAKTWVLAQMTMEPKYLPGIPLAADGGAHRRYGLAKN
jgi:DNA polymerase I-like protein with 3'-5' exonuclease and polymerase domains